MASSISLEKKLKEQEANKPKTFTYNKQKPVYSFNEKRPEYTYDDSRLQEYYDKLMNRKDFSFDINGNALFNQYKDYYQKQGQLAMMDTMGQASALTGGFGNSYAASAGQQAYQQNLDKLNDVVPELYQLALQQYQMEGDNLQSMYGILADDRDFAYNRYLGDVDIWQGERDFAYQKYRGDTDDYYTDKGFAYDQYRDAMADWENNRDYLYGQYIDQRDYEHTLERDKVADKQWQQEYNLELDRMAEQIRQFNMEYNLSEKEFNEMIRQFSLEYNLNERELSERVRQHEAEMAYKYDRAEAEDKQWQQQFEYETEDNASDLPEGAQAVKQADLGKLFEFVNDPFRRQGAENTYQDNYTPASATTVEDFEITQADEFFLNRFSKILNEYGIDPNDNVAILDQLNNPSLGLSDEEVRKYYYALTA